MLSHIKRTGLAALGLSALLSPVAAATSSKYEIDTVYEGESFFSGFNFFTVSRLPGYFRANF
jgi:hypothetical protein